MKKIISILAFSLALVSCNRQFDNAMKSADKALILKTADELYAKKKWTQALSLYERASKLVADSDDLADVLFKSAYAEYYEEKYREAAHHFKKFSINFPKDPRAEEAAYMAAQGYYKGSMDYNLDQSTSESALNELQEFLNNYPNSERSKNIRELMDEVNYKLELKAFENAKQYFKMAEYKAANVAFENVLSDFPSTKLRPQIYDYIMKSRYELAMNSIYDLKAERLDNAIAYTKFIEKESPELQKTAASLREKLDAEKIRFAEVQKNVEEQRERIEKKMKAEAEKQELRNSKKHKTEIAAEAAVAGANQVRTDSAEANTPAPAATLEIKN